MGCFSWELLMGLASNGVSIKKNLKISQTPFLITKQLFEKKVLYSTLVIAIVAEWKLSRAGR